MKVLLVHNRYREEGGEDVAFEDEAALLRERGHDVEVIERTNTSVAERGLAAKARLFAGTIWSPETYTSAREVIHRFGPDIVHVHNTLPLVSPSIYYAAWSENVPVVQTLHNYRLVCPAATLYRDKRTCVDCVGRSGLPGVLHACYRDSRLATGAVTAMLEVHRLLKTWRRVDAYIAVSEFVRSAVVRGGLPQERVHVKPNFVRDDGQTRVGPGEYALFVGRLTQEKGVHTLINAWITQDGLGSLPLKVIGSGPLGRELGQLTRSRPNIELLGRKSRPEVMRFLANARFLVCPSEWHEPLAFVALEALSAGVPLLLTRLGGFSTMIKDGKQGYFFTAGDQTDLARSARLLARDIPANLRMGAAARETYLARYTPQRTYQQQLEIYRTAQRTRDSARSQSTRP